jgi:hypothetical protein
MESSSLSMSQTFWNRVRGRYRLGTSRQNMDFFFFLNIVHPWLDYLWRVGG